jgi:allantoate deiminase
LADALLAFGGDPAGVSGLKRDRSSALAYFEMHIEQGPVLEAEDLPVGIVTSIASISRATAVVTGEAGHAGTVPMRLRRDALAATAEMALAMERLASGHAGAVATVGELTVEPGAINVIPGRVIFTLDMRAPDDGTRHMLVAEIKAELAGIAARRGVGLVVDEFFDAAACPCDSVVISTLEEATRRAEIRPFRLASGAGHDAMAMAALCPVGMLFVRCEKGISHNPLEKITLEDCDAAIRVFLDAVRHFRPAA